MTSLFRRVLKAVGEAGRQLYRRYWLNEVGRRNLLLQEASDAVQKASNSQLAVVKFTVNGNDVIRPAANVRNLMNDINVGQQPATGSDVETAEIIANDAYNARVEIVDLPERAEARGEFYPYLLSAEAERGLALCNIDLRPLQIFSAASFKAELKNNPNHVAKHCLWNTLQKLLNDGGKKALAHLDLKTIAGGAVKKRVLAKIAALYNVNVRLYMRVENAPKESGGSPSAFTQTRVYKAPNSNEEISIGLLSGHFFPNSQLYPKDSKGRPADLKKLISTGSLGGLAHDVVSAGDKYFRAHCGASISTLNLLKRLQESGYVRPFTVEEIQSLGLSRTQQEFKKTNHFLRDLFIPTPQFDDPAAAGAASDDEPLAETSAPRGAEAADRVDGLSVWYADFETFVGDGGRHVAYLACALPRGGGSASLLVASDPAAVRRGQEGCVGKALLRKICRNSTNTDVRVYFHNLRYDANFLYSANLTSLSTIEADSRLYELRGTLKVEKVVYRITIRDSFSYLQCKLSEFGAMFGLEESEKWADFPYAVFTQERLKSYQASPNLFTAEELATVPRRYRGANSVNLYRFATDYCAQDCRVLQQGFDRFRELGLELGLDVDEHRTAAGFSTAYMKKEGVLLGVEPLGGVERAYVQQSIVGGRVCVRGNRPVFYEAVKSDRATHLVDFDAVSLYPSAMATIRGFPKGSPERFESDPYRGGDAGCPFYVATVRLTALRRKLHMSTLSSLSPDGSRCWGKDCVKVGDVMVLNRSQVESAQKHQGAEFEFIGGLRWSGGYNAQINDVIKKLFDWRLRLKASNNPLEKVVKLIMNSFYGKLAERPRDVKVRWIRGGEEKANAAAAATGCGFMQLESANASKTLWKLKYASPNMSHTNYAHCGSLILAHSKEIMYQVTTPLDDDVLYTDTDSIILPAGALAKLDRPDLVGSGMGQFHSDLKWSAAAGPERRGEVTATSAWFLAKKTYVLELENSAAPGKRQHHVRAKGVPNVSILAACERKGLSPLELYEEAHRCGVEIDLTEGRPCFKQHPTSIVTRADFRRKIGPFADGPALLGDADFDSLMAELEASG